MKRRVVAHPTGPGLLHMAGRGGPGPPGPGGVLGPIMPIIPGAPGTPPNQAGQKALSDLQQLQQQLSSAIQSAVAKFLPAGEILIGVLLMVAGLLLATGMAGRGAKLGLTAATRGLVK